LKAEITNTQYLFSQPLPSAERTTPLEATIRPGLEGVVAASTRLSSVDGLAGELIIAGFSLEELAERATFEETVYLLWHDRRPNATELEDFRHGLASWRPLPQVTVDLLRATALQRVPAMDALRMAAGTISLDATISEDQWPEAKMLLARFPVIVATYWRLYNGADPIAPDPTLSHAANYLYMLTGESPTPAQVRGLETYLNTVSDHGFNASTFTARVIISTGTDLTSAIVGAVGALKGPLHGGAPGPALDMVFEIGDAQRAEAVLREKLERGERLMGFGHRIYKVRDPRAEVLSSAAARMFHAGGDMALYDLACSVEETAVRLLEEYKPGRNLQTNVEFYTALLLHGLGLETELFTPTFAIGRVAGWIAHCFEQQEANRIIRPQSVYHGEKGRRWEG
jgi:citrate synthase